MNKLSQPKFLPMNREEMRGLGWRELDILLVSGDAYVDHPAFGVALIGRWLVGQGFRVGVAAQPDWKKPESVRGLGRPRLFAGVTAGAMDSLVSNYTANKKLRRDDVYAPGGQYGLRPNRATLVYTSLVKAAFPGLPVVLGGIEASLRRLAHYDYWEDQVRRSQLVDAKADLLVYGMAERAVAEIARRLAGGQALEGIPGTVRVAGKRPEGPAVRELPSFERVRDHKTDFLEAALAEEAERDWRKGKVLVQAHGTRWVVAEPPAPPLTTPEMDALYALPFSRRAHPSYSAPIPALASVSVSLSTHRGCFGGCTYCALGAHQGKSIQSRSRDSILAEIRALARTPDFHGTVSDLGGPTANMYGLGCARPEGECGRPSCLVPEICALLRTDHQPQLELLRRAKTIPRVKNVFIASGIRYDLALCDSRYIQELVRGRHISGTLKVAPEHVEDRVLSLMRKPGWDSFRRFMRVFRRECAEAGRPASCTAYFISAFPGSTPEDMRHAAEAAGQEGLRVEPMQDFIPLPMTLAGAMYHTGLNPWTRQPLAIAKSPQARQQQRKNLLHRGGPAWRK